MSKNKRSLENIRESAIDKSFAAIAQIEKVLEQEIEIDLLDPEKAKQAVQGKREAQAAIFDMVMRIQQEQDYLDQLNNEVSERQKNINKYNSGFAEGKSK